jgi:hypothetical protein
MLKCSVVLIAALFSVSAHASKARLSSLQKADHLVDSQSVFNYPSHISELKPYLTFEFGQAGTSAEGGILRSLESGNKLLVYLGHQNSTAISQIADQRVGGSYLTQNNPVEVIYGTGDLAYGLSLSSVDNKKSATKETTVVLKVGKSIEGGAIYAHLTPVATAEKVATAVTNKLTTSPRLKLGGQKASGTNHYFGSLTYGDGKEEVGTGDVKIKDTEVVLGYEDRSLKLEGSDIYMGAALEYAQRDKAGAKITTTQLPIFLGIEHQMNSWSTFRGSVSQNLLLGSTKDETATNTDADGIASNTTAAAGLGLTYGKLQLDGSLTAATDGKVNGNSFLAQTSVTYNF